MTILVDGDRFGLQSWYNGLSYYLVNRQLGMEYYCQGDGAIEFERQREAAETAFPDKSDEEILDWLWSRYCSDEAIKVEES